MASNKTLTEGNETMTQAQIRIEIAELEDLQIGTCDNLDAFHGITEHIKDLKRQLYADQPAALVALGLLKSNRG